MDFAHDVGDVKALLFTSDLRMENDLQEQIAQLFGELGVVRVIERVQDFIGFFEKERAQARVRLLVVPGAAVGRAEPRLQGDQLLEPLSRRKAGGVRGFPASCRHLFCFLRFAFLRIHQTSKLEQAETGVPLYGRPRSLTSGGVHASGGSPTQTWKRMLDWMFNSCVRVILG